MDEPEPWVGPPGDLLGQPAEVDHRERHRCQHLDHEVPVRDGVERVGRHAVEAELRRGGLAVQRVSRAGQRTGSQGRDVEPAAGIEEAAAIPLEHLDVRQQVMGEQHRLGRLDVGRAGQHGVPLALGEVHQRPLQADDPRDEPVHGPPGPQPEVGGHLVVARAAGVQLAAHAADALGEQRLEVHVDVLEGRIPGDRPRFDVLAQPDQPALEDRDLVLGQQPGSTEPADVRDRARDIVQREHRVDLDGARELRHPRVRPLAEPTAPQPHGSLRAG